MSRREQYFCDRCKKEVPGVRIVDLGNDYTAGKDEFGQKHRIGADLCGPCWEALKAWLENNAQV